MPVVLLMVRTPSTVDAPRVLVIDLDDTIQPASLRYVERGLRQAADEKAALVVIELDTPGGLLDSLRVMTSAILASPVPVVVYVTPSGARAASAGFFLLIASDIAAMAPGTNTGAAHPIAIGERPRTRDSREEDKDGKRDVVDPAVDKAVNDAAALARSLAAGRKRSVKAAEQAVVEATSFTADEALARGLIDEIATDREQLLRAIDGRTITRMGGRTETLELDGAEIVPVDRTFAERVLTVIAAPQVAYLLLMLGAIGLMIELMSPGGLVPGIAGAISLLLGIYGLSVLPVNVSGALLIAVGLGLIVAEVFVVSYGFLAIAGIACFVIGSLILVDAPVPDLAIGPEVVVPVTIVLAAITAILAIRAVRSRHLPSQAGVEAMLGEAGDIIERVDPGHDGKVFIHGEYWAATATQPLPEGTKVRVEAVDGLRLRVSPFATIHDRGGAP